MLDLTYINTALIEYKAKAVDGIIGADILEKGKVKIDYKNKCVYLKKLIFKLKKRGYLKNCKVDHFEFICKSHNADNQLL